MFLAAAHARLSPAMLARIDFAGPIPDLRPDLGPCWLYLGGLTHKGYGRIIVAGKQRRVHSVVYEELVGPLPHGLVPDHLCRIRRCCNPGHIEAVTNGENVMRGTGLAPTNAAKQTCPLGHPYDDLNTYRRPDGNRGCKACKKEAAKKSRRRVAH